MRIEFGFQANCSELVSSITFHTLEEVITAMRRIHEITGWSWRITDFDSKFSVLIPMERICAFLVVNDDGYGFGVYPKSLFEYWEPIADPEIFRSMRQNWTNPDYLAIPSLTNIPLEEPVVHYEFGPHDTIGHLGWSDMSKKRELSLGLMIEHYDVHLMPVFHWIRMEYGADIDTEDGGSEWDYYSWLSCHYHDSPLFQETLKREYPHGELPKLLRNALEKEDLQAHPPFSVTKDLPEKEVSKIVEYMR